MHWSRVVWLVVAAGCGGGCGGDASEVAPAGTVGLSSDSSNVVRLMVDAGTGKGHTWNRARISVVVCVPGSPDTAAADCQRVDHVIVDTGSTGLRINRSALEQTLLARLPSLTSSAGKSILECMRFSTTYLWGPLRRADVHIGGSVAPGLALHLIDDTAAAPAECAGSGTDGEPRSRGNMDQQSSNGIIGLGTILSDGGWFFACTDAQCSASARHVPELAGRVRQPVSAFSTDNNGMIIELPIVADNRAAGVEGTLTFGIGTRTNNVLDTENVFPLEDFRYMTDVAINGKGGRRLMLDTGVAYNWYDDTELPICAGSRYLCPASEQTRVASLRDVSGKAVPMRFKVANATALFAVPGMNAYSALALVRPAAAYPADPLSAYMGLPFFYGRKVFMGMVGGLARTPAGIDVVGPFNALAS